MHGVPGLKPVIGELKPGFYADIIAVPGNPLLDVRVLGRVAFVMKGGVIAKRPASVQQHAAP